MIINAVAVPEGYSEAAFTISNEDRPPDWPVLSEPVTCQCRINRHGREISVEIDFSAGVSVECARCLKRFSHSVESTVVVVLEPTDPEKLDETDEDHAVFFYSEQQPEVDLAPAIFDELVTSLPMMPLCSATCAGIAVARQSQSNTTESDSIDPRWEVLKKLKKAKD